MSMERLQRAALAAGFAMAAPDDDVPPAHVAEQKRNSEVKYPSNVPAVVVRPHTVWELSARRALAPVSALGARLWQRLPSLTGRATA